MVKRSLLFTLVTTTLATLVLAESDVIELNETNFDSNVLTKDTILVEFYSPQCGHCKALAPEYEMAATELKDIVPLAKIDCTVHKETCLQNQIKNYPTLKVFKSGKSIEYQGIRKSVNIIDYMKKQTVPVIQELNANNFNAFKDSDRFVVVGYISDDVSTALFKKLAEKHHSNFFFGIVTDEALAQAHDAHVPSIVVYKKYDNGRDDFKGVWSEKALEDFIVTSAVPLVQDINVANLRYYIDSGVALAYIFHENEEDKQRLGDMVRPIAQKQKGKVNFVYMDGARYGGHAKTIGLKGGFPAFAIQHFEDGTKFPFQQELTLENLDRFVQDYVDGKLEPTVRSGEPPANNEGPIKTVVADTFSEIVLDPENDVFLSIYGQTGDYNKKLAPVWEHLGELLMKETKIVIAHMDHGENDVPPQAGFRLSNLPTLVYYKAGTNELVHYDGDRSLESLIYFINENNSVNVKLQYPSKQTEEQKESTTHDEL